VSERIVCPWCGGAGMLAPMGCDGCDGEGTLLTARPWPEMTATMGRAKCPACEAVGLMEGEWRLETVPPEDYQVGRYTLTRKETAHWWPWAVCGGCKREWKAAIG